MNSINELFYGNPPIDTLGYINAHSPLDILFNDLSDTRYAFPANDSNITKQELNQLAQFCSSLQKEAEIAQRYHRYDVSLINFYTDVRFDTQEEIDEYQKLLISVFEDILPLIFKLKHHWQRPRPYQLAHYHKLKLFPFNSYSANSAAYPSLHACASRVLGTVLSNHYPDAIKYFVDISNDVALSRLYTGVNYQSSIDYGKMIADKIVLHPDFVNKYKL